MHVQTIEVDGIARYAVRPVDRKAMMRFLNRARDWLLRDNPDGTVSHRDASDEEHRKWDAAHDLHRVWGGDEDGFFGIPL